MSKIIFINRFYYPDHSATSQLLSDLTFFLADRGINISVLASRQEYGDPASELPVREDINGVEVYRVRTTRFGRQHLVGRAIDYMSFYIGAFIRLLVDVKAGDIVVAKTDPPLISVFTAIVVKLKRAKLVNWVQDLFPEVATVLGVKMPSLLEYIIIRLRNWSLDMAQVNVVLGKRMGEVLRRNGVSQSRISVIPNWSSENIVPVRMEENVLKNDWNLQGKFVVGYSGNMGRAHEFDTILETAQLLSNNKQIVFLFIGGGAQYEYIREQARIRKLTNIVFMPYQPRENLALSLGVADIHLISLLPALEGLIVPSKFYGIAAAGRPTIYIGDMDGEIPVILKEAGCGDVVAIGNAKRLHSIICSYSKCDKGFLDMGQRAREVFEHRFSARHAMEKWMSLFIGMGA